ncbi:MAG: response regulator, partial [Terriglobales bacterium]
MPTALLLSPDDQAVSAISAVLEEMSVTCERPLDGVSAAQKLHSHTFDLVLVDCDNLPAAKLIFDVCRRGKGSNNPVPIAIVDGRAGLPTAFRLGAELILTKPVAKDQARSTIRTAVSRVKKEETVQAAGQVNPNEANAGGGLKTQDSPIPLAGQEMSDRKMADNTKAQGRVLAAAAGVKSPLSASVPAVLGSLASPDAEALPAEAESEPSVAPTSGNLVPAKLLKAEGETRAQRPVLAFDSQSQNKQSQSVKSRQDLSKQGHNQKDQSEEEEKKQSRLVAVLVLLT